MCPREVLNEPDAIFKGCSYKSCSSVSSMPCTLQLHSWWDLWTQTGSRYASLGIPDFSSELWTYVASFLSRFSSATVLQVKLQSAPITEEHRNPSDQRWVPQDRQESKVIRTGITPGIAGCSVCMVFILHIFFKHIVTFCSCLFQNKNNINHDGQKMTFFPRYKEKEVLLMSTSHGGFTSTNSWR